MPVPDLADPRAPYLQIADDLREQIRVGRYQPGDRLPSNAVMASEYRSASETIRNALRKLRDEGLVATQSTRGTFVLRAAAEPEPDPDVVRLESALRDVLRRLDKLEDRLAGLESGP
ncbi:MAG TPA: winged helix-turn-helix domain-containing protein [Streptosporangiaceae bacterium]